MNVMIQATLTGVASVAVLNQQAVKMRRVATFAVQRVAYEAGEVEPSQDSRAVAVMPFAMLLEQPGLTIGAPVRLIGSARPALIAPSASLAQLQADAERRRNHLHGEAKAWFARHAPAHAKALAALSARHDAGKLSGLQWLDAQGQLLFPRSDVSKAFAKYQAAQLKRLNAAGAAQAAVTTPVYELYALESVGTGAAAGVAGAEGTGSEVAGVPAPKPVDAVPVIRAWEVDEEAEWRRWVAATAAQS